MHPSAMRFSLLPALLCVANLAGSYSLVGPADFLLDAQLRVGQMEARPRPSTRSSAVGGARGVIALRRRG